MILTAPETDVDYYPSSDGKPMADNTIQFKWITKVKGGLDAVFYSNPDVFVAGDLLWYPVRGRRKICAAPDVMVAFGRPKGDRKSYIQFKEGDIPPQVVFEIYSSSNDEEELQEKFEFYQRYGVEEYYFYDPYDNILEGWQRRGSVLVPISNIAAGYTSPRLKVHFRVDPEWILTGPDGRAFVDYAELAHQRDSLAKQRDAATEKTSKLEQEIRDLKRLLESLSNPPSPG